MADAPRFAQQTLTWAWTLIDLAHVAPERIVVHALEGSDESVRRQLEALGVRTRSCQPFRAIHPHCNKLRQLEDEQLHDADVVVLCDSDTAFVSGIDDALSPPRVRARIVDLPNPPNDVWIRILEAAAFPAPPPFSRTSFGDHTTPSINCNGGLYVLPGPVVRDLAAAWPAWAHWLIDRPELLPGAQQVHVDQVSFGLATLELGLVIHPLSPEFNFPTHRAVGLKPDLRPRVIHYHGNVNPSGFLQPVGQPQPDAAIAEVNEVVRLRRRRHFENAPFWDFRYSSAPDLGSGIGSRGSALQTKRAVLAREVGPEDSVLDIGCGDLEVSRGLPIRTFTGVDVSSEALAIAKAKRPDWTFLLGTAHRLNLERHDVVVCFDVLIHQRDQLTYRSMITQLLRQAGRTLVVAAYNQPPWHQSEITFYHEPVSDSLGRLAGHEHLEIIGGYRDCTVIRVDVAAALETSTELRTLSRARACDTAYGRMMALPGDLITTQFEQFGGHTRNELAMVLSLLEPGDLVVDVGAHLGSFAIPMARAVGRAGLVVAIEPDPINLALLSENVAGNDVGDRTIVVPALVSDQTTRFRPVPDEANTGAVHFLADPSGSHEAVSVDRILSAHAPGLRPALIKIDVEGMELQVLRSAARTIAVARPLIYCEAVEPQLGRQGTTLEDLDEFFRARDYALYRNIGERNSTHDRFEIVPVGSIREGGPFFDCLAVPREAVHRLRRLSSPAT